MYTDRTHPAVVVHAAGPPAGAAAGPLNHPVPEPARGQTAKATPKQWDPRVIVGPSRDQLSIPNSFHRSKLSGEASLALGSAVSVSLDGRC